MIPAAKNIATSSGTSSATPLPGAEAPTTAFDAILSLETLAATTAADAVTSAATGAATGAPFSLEGVCLESLAEGDLTDDDDTDLEETEDGEAVDALAFLADLLNVAAVTRQASVGHAGGELAANDDVLSGSAQPSGEAKPPIDSPITATGEDVATDKLAGQATPQATLTALTDAGLERLDAARPTDEGISRAAEWVQAPRHASAAPERSAIAAHVRDPRWAEEFGTRIALMVRGGESSASLQLSPADLGPLDVSVTIRDTQASIHFGAAQAETRALIEASLPRLREMLAAQGFQLMDSSVSSGFSQAHREPGAPGVHAAVEPETSTPETRPLGSLSLLDLYV